MYAWLGICIGLVLLALSYSLACLAVALVWPLLDTGPRKWAPHQRANLLFGLRIAPAVLSISFIILAAAPSYGLFEPRETQEPIGLALAGSAALAALAIGFCAWRAVRSWLHSKRMVAKWMRAAQPIAVEGVAIPAYCLDLDRPVLALAGIVRPRLFVARPIIASLLPQEFSAAVAHERGHLYARDNLRRFLLRLFPDVLRPFRRRCDLDAMWAEAAEIAADAHAGRRGAQVALDLASALIKVARLTPPQMNSALSTCALLLSANSRAGMAGRIERLTALAEPCAARRPRLAGSHWFALAGMFGLIILVELLTSEAWLHATHELIEGLVRALN